LLVPLLFLLGFSIAIRRYNRALRPVAGALNERFGVMNADLAEAIGGMEVVKGFAQVPHEERRFAAAARAYRDSFVRPGAIQARYVPLLLYGLAIGLAFGHAVVLVLQGQITVGQAITYMTLMETLRSPTMFSLTTFAAVQLGLTSAARILKVIRARTELDENSSGYSAPIRGEIVFEDVSFGYGDHRPPTSGSDGAMGRRG